MNPPSRCVGKPKTNCKSTKNCGYASGSQRRFCRIKRSLCAKKNRISCFQRRKTCKYASGSQRQFCRRKRNTKRHTSRGM